MKFWDWALAVYARPGLASACLELQDAHGQSVPFLLWAVWAAQQGRMPPSGVLAEGADLAARWEAVAVGPLRQARRGLKTPFAGVPDAAREGLRAEVKALELGAERRLMEALEALAPAAATLPQPLDEALAAASAQWTPPAPPQALRTLAQFIS